MQNVISRKLERLGCTVLDFTNGPAKGVIGRTRLVYGLKNDDLDHGLVEKLVGILGEMEELKRLSPVALDWSDSQNICEMLHSRRQLRAVVFDDEYVISDAIFRAAVIDEAMKLLAEANGTTT